MVILPITNPNILHVSVLNSQLTRPFQLNKTRKTWFNSEILFIFFSRSQDSSLNILSFSTRVTWQSSVLPWKPARHGSGCRCIQQTVSVRRRTRPERCIVGPEPWSLWRALPVWAHPLQSCLPDPAKKEQLSDCSKLVYDEDKSI